MKFYVAAKWELKEQVGEIYRTITEKGHEISEDWLKHKSIKPYDENQEISRKYSVLDVNGVRSSDVFVLLTDEDGIGMYVELGVAIMSYIARRKPRIYVIGKNLGRSMFFFHPAVKIRKTIEDVLEEIEN